MPHDPQNSSQNSSDPQGQKSGFGSQSSRKWSWRDWQLDKKVSVGKFPCALNASELTRLLWAEIIYLLSPLQRIAGHRTHWATVRKCARLGCNDGSVANTPGRGRQDQKVTSLLWLCFRGEPKATSKAKAWYDILHRKTLFLQSCGWWIWENWCQRCQERCKSSGQRSGVSFVLVHWATITNIIFV